MPCEWGIRYAGPHEKGDSLGRRAGPAASVVAQEKGSWRLTPEPDLLESPPVAVQIATGQTGHQGSNVPQSLSKQLVSRGRQWTSPSCCREPTVPIRKGSPGRIKTEG